jgi:hypothetical protein
VSATRAAGGGASSMAEPTALAVVRRLTKIGAHSASSFGTTSDLLRCVAALMPLSSGDRTCVPSVSATVSRGRLRTSATAAGPLDGVASRGIVCHDGSERRAVGRHVLSPGRGEVDDGLSSQRCLPIGCRALVGAAGARKIGGGACGEDDEADGAGSPMVQSVSPPSQLEIWSETSASISSGDQFKVKL